MKIAFSICLTLLFASFSVAQDAATIAPPAAPSPDVNPVAEVVEAAAAEVAPAVVEAVAVEQAETELDPAIVSSTEAAPVEITAATPAEVVLDQGVVIDQGIVIDQGAIIENTPVYSEGQMIQGEVFSQDAVYSENQIIGSYGDSVMSYDQGFVAESAQFAPMAAEVVSPVVTSDPFAAPSMVAPAPVANYAAAPACVNCEPQGRRQIFRTVTTRSRSMFTRVRGLIGRRR